MRRMYHYYVLLLIFLFASNSWAFMVEVPLEDLVKRADYIYAGKITAVETFKKQLGPGNYGVYTLANLKIKKAIKGEKKSSVSIFIIGGVIDGKDYRMSISPQYFSNEEVVVFLKEESDGSLRTLHHQLGKKSFGSQREKNLFIVEIEKILVGLKK